MSYMFGAADTSNPVYNAGFNEGRKFEKELAQEAAAKEKDKEAPKNIGKVKGITVSVKVSEMDLFKELATVTHDLAEACRIASHIPECKEAFDKFMDFQVRQDLIAIERAEKLESK